MTIVRTGVRLSTSVQTRGGTSMIESLPQLPTRPVRFTEQDVRDPVKLAKILTDLTEHHVMLERALSSVPFLPGTLVRDVALTNATNKIVAHRLGRAFRGFFLLRARTAVGGAREVAQTPASLNDVQITLLPNATMTVDVWVY